MHTSFLLYKNSKYKRKGVYRDEIMYILAIPVLKLIIYIKQYNILLYIFKCYSQQNAESVMMNNNLDKL